MPARSPKSSSSVPGSRRGGFPAVLELGQALVAELGLADSTDTLGRWMAHYVAELMEEARTTTPENRDLVEQRCATAILDLWDHRAGLSDGRLPMTLGPAVAALDRLDPTAPQPIYFRNTWRELGSDVEQEAMLGPSQAWLQTAERIDQAARTTIVYALGKAAEVEADRAKRWVELAEKAGADGALDIQLVRRLIRIGVHGEDDSAARIEDLRDKIGRLAEFRQVAEAIEAEWSAELASITTESTAISVDNTSL